jgi:hypothetical protein
MAIMDAVHLFRQMMEVTGHAAHAGALCAEMGDLLALRLLPGFCQGDTVE